MRRLPRLRRLRVNAGAVQYDLDPDNASILVCGGGGVALHVTRKLKNMGSWVWQLQRTDVRRQEIEKMMAIVAKGDALSKEDVQRVFDSELQQRWSLGCSCKSLLCALHATSKSARMCSAAQCMRGVVTSHAGPDMYLDPAQMTASGIEEVDAVVSTIGGTTANPQADSQVSSAFVLSLG